MNPRHIFVLGLALAAFGWGCSAKRTSSGAAPPDTAGKQSSRWAGLDAYVGQYGATWGETYAFNGCVMARDETGDVFEKCYGLADRKTGRVNSKDTPFRVGSVSKQFTAAAVMTLVERGRVELSAGICTYVDPCAPHYRDITVHHLLTHSSGVPNYTDFKDYNDFKGQARTPAELYAYFSTRELEFQPGTKFNYSNSGYALLGLLIESVSGQSYGAYLREAVFNPAGLKSTAYAPAAYPGVAARGYHPDEHERLYVNHTDFHLSVGFSGGGIVSTLDDLVAWDRALREGRVLTEESLEVMFSPFLDRYAYGWEVDTVDGRRLASHAGQVSGFSTYIARALDGHQLIIAWANNDQFSTERLTKAAQAVMQGREPPMYREEPLANLDASTRRAFAGTYRLEPESRSRALAAGVLAKDLEVLRSLELKLEDDELRFFWVQLYGTTSGSLVVPRWGLYLVPISKPDGSVSGFELQWQDFNLRYFRA